MTLPVPNKDSGWHEWLKQYGIDDLTLSENAAYLRYQRFVSLDLGEVAEGDKYLFYRNLLPLERGMVFGDSIGLAP